MICFVIFFSGGISSFSGIHKSKRLNDKEKSLGRVMNIVVVQNGGGEGNNNENDVKEPTTVTTYEIEWILERSRLQACEREDLRWTSADDEGMTDSQSRQRNKRKPAELLPPVVTAAATPAITKKPAAKKAAIKKPAVVKKTAKSSGTAEAGSNNTAATTSSTAASAAAVTTKKRKSPLPTAANKNEKSTLESSSSSSGKKKKKPRKQESEEPPPTTTEPPRTMMEMTEEVAAVPPPSSLDLYDRHRREFERFFTRLKERVDLFHHFWETAPPDFDEQYHNMNDDTMNNDDSSIITSSPLATTPSSSSPAPTTAAAPAGVSSSAVKSPPPPLDGMVMSSITTSLNAATPLKKATAAKSIVAPYPSHAPYNWDMIHRRMEYGRYILDRRQKEEDDRCTALAAYYASTGRRRGGRKKKKTESDARVKNAKGVHWDLFRQDVFAMCDAALQRRAHQKPSSRDDGDDDDHEMDEGQRGSLSYTIKKVREAVQQTVDRTGKRHGSEMDNADDRFKYSQAVQRVNAEAAMQSWRKVPFPERRYERLQHHCTVCDGLSVIDERIAQFERKTSLADRFIGQAYHYDDTGESELWMRSVVDETDANDSKSSKRKAKKYKTAETKPGPRTADDEVIRAQVAATMQGMLITVQDTVMTSAQVMHQPELRSDNWLREQQQQQQQNDKVAAAVPVAATGVGGALDWIEQQQPQPEQQNDAATTTPIGSVGAASDIIERPPPDEDAATIGVGIAASDAVESPQPDDGVAATASSDADMTVDITEQPQPPDNGAAATASGSADMTTDIIKQPQQPDHGAVAPASGGGAEDMVTDIMEQPQQPDHGAAPISGGGEDMATDIIEPQQPDDAAAPVDMAADIIEQPVWGIDCYTRLNIIHCLEIEFDKTIALRFIEKWLLPAINACPNELAHDIGNAARILMDEPITVSTAAKARDEIAGDHGAMDWTSQNALGRALKRKIATVGTVWLKPCARELLRARDALGLDFFRVHPKGHGSVVLANTIPANRLVTFYHGELYPSWRWGEKMDAIEITQKRKALKP
jgi:hypothetical protein